AAPRKFSKAETAIRFEARAPPLPERRARRERQNVREQIPRDVHRLDEEVAILNADVNVRAEDEQLLREILQVLLDTDVSLERRDLLFGPPRERMRPRGGDDEVAPC